MWAVQILSLNTGVRMETCDHSVYVDDCTGFPGSVGVLGFSICKRMCESKQVVVPNSIS